MEKEDFWRKAWLFSQGLVDFTRTKIEALGEEMIKRGELSQQEGSRAVEEFSAQMETAQEAFFEKVREMVNKAVHDMGLLRRLEDLEKRISALEKENVELEIEGRQGTVID